MKTKANAKTWVALLMMLTLCACGGGDDSPVTASQTAPAPLSLEGFVAPSQLLNDACAFQKSFVGWFAQRTAADIVVSDETCSDASYQAGAYPEEFRDLEGRCTAEHCTVHSFTLSKGSQSQKFMGLLLRRSGKSMGLIIPLQPHAFTVYVSRKPVASSYYLANQAKAFASYLPLISLTFSEAVNRNL